MNECYIVRKKDSYYQVIHEWDGYCTESRVVSLHESQGEAVDLARTLGAIGPVPYFIESDGIRISQPYAIKINDEDYTLRWVDEWKIDGAPEEICDNLYTDHISIDGGEYKWSIS
jgi:hypothetical protein